MVESATFCELSGAAPTPDSDGSFVSESALRDVQEAQMQMVKAKANILRVTMIVPILGE